VGVDIFTFHSKDYLLTVDYLSGFAEIDRLPSKAVTDIVHCLKQHFARYGLPDQVMSDNSPFKSAEFSRFAAKYEFEHITSSPNYAQSNGRVENAIRTVKRLLTKAREEHSDPYLALLDWRNTPAEQLGPSPAQLLMGRRTRTRLPTNNRLLDTPLSTTASTALKAAKERQAFYYNRNAKDRTPLPVGQTVRVKYKIQDPEWRKAEVAEVLPHRSYNVRFDDGTIRRRTAKHVRFSTEPAVIVDDGAESNIQANCSNTTSAAAAAVTLPPRQTEGQIITRSGRVVKRPARYLE
jgi:hypothetical protein